MGHLKPDVSVILPVYNREKLVGKSIQSVLDRIHTNFELIIVNDGSTDGTLDVLSDFAGKDDRIVLVNTKNGGVANARNIALFFSHPSARWLAAIDSDDEYLPDHLEKRFEFLKEYPGLDYSYGTMKINGDERVTDKNDLSKKIHISETSRGATIFVRKKVFETLGGYHNVYGEDGDLLERAIAAGFNVMKCPYETYVYNRGLPDSLTTLIQKQQRV